LKKRGELDGTPEVVDYATKLEEAALETIESGIMTGDMARIAEPKPDKAVGTEEFIDAIARRLEGKLL
jgi:isocitrate dehydrogenase